MSWAKARTAGRFTSVIASTNVMLEWVDCALAQAHVQAHHTTVVLYEPIAKNQLALQDENSNRTVWGKSLYFSKKKSG